MKPGFYWARFKFKNTEIGLLDWEPVQVNSSDNVQTLLDENHYKISDFRWGDEIESPSETDKGKIK